ncbi:MAG: hypothetical protein K0R15_1310 [Clostridiales bacterium]|jgi:hypothetical protein|nr:hypothetical protein [Clostridiales bacterium]
MKKINKIILFTLVALFLTSCKVNITKSASSLPKDPEKAKEFLEKNWEIVEFDGKGKGPDDAFVSKIIGYVSRSSSECKNLEDFITEWIEVNNNYTYSELESRKQNIMDLSIPEYYNEIDFENFSTVMTEYEVINTNSKIDEMKLYFNEEFDKAVAVINYSYTQASIKNNGEGEIYEDKVLYQIIKEDDTWKVAYRYIWE